MKEKGIGRIRRIRRASVERFNNNGVYLPNPNVSPEFDKHRPVSSDHKAKAFGFEPNSQKRLFDLPKGDAGAGQSVYRRVQAFYPMGGPTRVSEVNYGKPIAIITNRSSTKIHRYFHVSIYGFGVRVPTEGQPQSPQSIAELQAQQFEAIYINNADQTDITPRFVPSVCSCQARVMVHDESGQRFFDVDVIGSRSMDFYAWGVTVFLLLKDGGYEVDEQNPDSNLSITDVNGVENDVVGARVLPVSKNITKNPQQRTITISVDLSTESLLRRIIPIPPGAKTVQIFSNEPDPESVPWILEFWTGRASGARPDLGIINWDAGQSKTSIYEIPNASAIAISSTAIPAPATTGFSLVFEVQA